MSGGTNQGTEVTLRPFLKRGPHYVVSDFLYRNFIGPIVSFLESVSPKLTARWVEKQLKEDE